jgi:hypothetical protein
MKASNYFPRTLRLLKKIGFSNKTTNSNDSKNELIHPRFEISKNDPSAQKMVANSLLFLMYSKENEELFI